VRGEGVAVPEPIRGITPLSSTKKKGRKGSVIIARCSAKKKRANEREQRLLRDRRDRQPEKKKT